MVSTVGLSSAPSVVNPMRSTVSEPDFGPFLSTLTFFTVRCDAFWLRLSVISTGLPRSRPNNSHVERLITDSYAFQDLMVRMTCLRPMFGVAPGGGG